MSLPPSFKNELNALEREITKAQPKDVLQYCADFFNRRLASQRAEFHLAGNKSNGGMAETMSNPFGDKSPFANKNVNSINEEDEERDTFGSPTDKTTQDTGRSPFANASPFAAAAGSGAAGAAGGFGAAWATGGHTEQDQQAPANYAAGGRRVSVSAESMQPDADSGNWKPPKHAKTDDQLARLRTAVSGNFLFSHLDDDSFSTVLDALQEKSIPAPNIKVISQGDEGDYFYVIESGSFDIHIHPSGSVQSGADGMGNKVASIGSGGSFGELALMYNAPRAATVVSSSKGGMLWALDRVTFRRILMDSAFQKRRMYEGFLEEVHLLKDLKTYERAKIADALESVKYPAGTVIIKEGDAGDNFYLLESGVAQAFKRGTEAMLKEYERGGYFGELALLDDKPRAASVIAKTEVKVAKLGRDGFKRLLGPVESIMRREEYDEGAGMDPLTKKETVT